MARLRRQPAARRHQGILALGDRRALQPCNARPPRPARPPARAAASPSYHPSQVPHGYGAHKKVSLANPYTYDTHFALSTDRPDLLSFKQPTVLAPSP